MSAFYLLPLAIAAWWLDTASALVVAIASVGVWMGGNTVNGDVDFLKPLLAAWNGGVQLVSYVVVVLTVSRIRDLQRNLEQRVRDRTAALEALQLNLLQASEREQRRIGQDLHDGLCQHLAGAAFACAALREELAQHGLPHQAETAQELVGIINDGIKLSRQSAMGLDPVELSSSGLMEALEEFASATSVLYSVTCDFECLSPVLIHDGTVATHLLRIAQEATRNAVNHGKAKKIGIVLVASDDGFELSIEDDGIGISNTSRSHSGMGLAIMKRRTDIIGGSLEIANGPKCGTVVRVVLPNSALTRDTSRAQETL